MTLRTGIAVLVLFAAEGVGPRQALQGLAKLPRRPAGLRARALNSETELTPVSYLMYILTTSYSSYFPRV